MFESAELGHTIARAAYDREVPKLREKLLGVQYDLLEKKSASVIVLLAGVEAAGKGATLNLLNEWMDPRYIETNAIGEPSDDEERPPMWRFWRALPAKGKIGIFAGTWYSDSIANRVSKQITNTEFERDLADITRFELMLTDEGNKVFKFWLHLSKHAQRSRLKELERHASTRWRVTKEDWKKAKEYDRRRKVAEIALRETSTAHAPWLIVEATDPNYRNLTVGKLLLNGISERLEQSPKSAHSHAPPLVKPIDKRNVLSSIDLTESIKHSQYEKELSEWQGRLNALCRKSAFQKTAAVVLFEGPDAAGKGGSIRRVTAALDARQYRVIPISAPSEEELAQPYLWRFWRHVPRKGKFTIFDRSWYGRVLVERVMKLITPDTFMRAYQEINDFEADMVRYGIAVIKFWLQIDKEEQLKRFRQRESTGFKHYKITPDDWKNREHWAAYDQAACDMVERTSTDIAPWELVAANDKHFARVTVLKTICHRIEAAL